MTKYRQYVQKMLDENKVFFDEFRSIHDRYGLEQDSLQEELNRVGEKAMEIIRDYENRLCKTTEKTYSQYSGGLAQKFQDEVRKEFPFIDSIGIKVSNTPISSPNFNIKKISF